MEGGMSYSQTSHSSFNPCLCFFTSYSKETNCSCIHVGCPIVLTSSWWTFRTKPSCPLFSLRAILSSWLLCYDPLPLCVWLLSCFNGYSTAESIASIFPIGYFSMSAITRALLWTSLHSWALFFTDLICSNWYKWSAYVAMAWILLVGLERALWDQGSNLNSLQEHYNWLCVCCSLFPYN